MENDKLVSLVPFLAKTFKHAVFNSLLLSVNQPCLRSRHSTEMLLLTVVESLQTSRAAPQSSVLIVHDLSAVFDTKPSDLHPCTLRPGYLQYSA